MNVAQILSLFFSIKINIEYTINSLNFSRVQRFLLRDVSDKKLSWLW